MARPRSRTALVAAILGVLAVVDVLLGAGLAHFGIVRPLSGFMLFGVGLLEAIVGLVIGLVALARTRVRTGKTGRSLAWVGLGASAVVLALVAQNGSTGRGLPRINDVTTNPEDPPVFEIARSDPANAGRDMSYPPGFAAQQRAAYPDLAPIELPVAPGEALERARRAAEALGFEIAEVRPPQSEGADGVLEARQTSKLFRFVDDVIVRVRPAPGGSVVDVRSKSRNGQGDLGINAKRIRSFKAALTR